MISRAVPASESFFPKKGAIIIVSALATFLLAAIGIMLGELFSGRALRPSSPMMPGQMTPGQAAAGPATAAGDLPNQTADTPDELLLIANDADDFSAESVAEQLIGEHVSVAVCVAPEGDEGSAAAVMLARTVAGEGLQALLVDLTGSACPTELMAESTRLPGLTDLMCGEINISSSIHPDRLSSAHIIPRGNANARRAMRAIDRLPMIIDALTEAYDLVIVECGAADAASVARIARADAGEIILSLLRADEETVSQLLSDFHEQGYENVLLMTPSEPRSPLGSRSSAA